MSEPKKIKLKVKSGTLVAEIYESGGGIKPEISVHFLDEDQNIQDIALIREADGHDSFIECLVWADANDEDYTNKFLIGKYINRPF